jgi:hypothetical protein
VWQRNHPLRRLLLSTWLVVDPKLFVLFFFLDQHPHARLLMLGQRNTPNKYIKNYVFDYDFGPGWGNCNVTMTSVLGHITTAVFPPEYKDWRHPPPDRLFDCPVNTVYAEVGNVMMYEQ